MSGTPDGLANQPPKKRLVRLDLALLHGERLWSPTVHPVLSRVIQIVRLFRSRSHTGLTTGIQRVGMRFTRHQIRETTGETYWSSIDHKIILHIAVIHVVWISHQEVNPDPLGGGWLAPRTTHGKVPDRRIVVTAHRDRNLRAST